MKAKTKPQTIYHFAVGGEVAGIAFDLIMDGPKDCDAAVSMAKQLMSRYREAKLTLSEPTTDGTGIRNATLYLNLGNITAADLSSCKPWKQTSSSTPTVPVTKTDLAATPPS